MAYDDESNLIAEDVGFDGVDYRIDARQLRPGLGSGALNKDFRSRTAERRPGWYSPPWAEERAISFPVSFPAHFDLRVGLGKVFGALDFEDPNSGKRFTLLAVACGTYLIAANAVQRMILYPVDDAGVSGPVKMLQVFDVVKMYRGKTQATLVLNPDDDVRWTRVNKVSWPGGGRNPDSDNTYGDGSVDAPDSDEAEVLNGREYVKVDGDSLSASDIFDFSRHNPVQSRFRVNDGDSGEIVRVFKFNKQTLLVFKEDVIHLITGLYGNLGNAVNDVLTTEYGCVAKNTVVKIGKDVWFLASGGVYAVTQVLDNELQGDSEPRTAAVEPLIERINWNAVDGAVAAYYENRYYLAVPLDGASYNNALLVYDFVRRQWAGVWDSSFLDVVAFVEPYGAGERQFGVVLGDSANAANAGAVLIFGSDDDEIFGVKYPVSDEFLSRAYRPPNLAEMRAVNVRLDVKTLNPSMTVSLVMADAGHERVIVEDETRDPVQYFEFGKADWDPTNVTGDHGDRGREDYSVFFPAEVGVAFPVSFPVAFTDPVYAPFSPNLKQGFARNFRCSARGESVQVRVRSSQGVCDLSGLRVDADPGSRGLRLSV